MVTIYTVFHYCPAGSTVHTRAVVRTAPASVLVPSLLVVDHQMYFRAEEHEFDLEVYNKLVFQAAVICASTSRRKREACTQIYREIPQ